MYMCMKHYIPDIIVTPLTGVCVRNTFMGAELAETSSQTLQICDLLGTQQLWMPVSLLDG